MSTSNKFQKIFSSSDLAYAIRQAEQNGYKVLTQDRAMAGITHETPVTVVEFKPATTTKSDYAGRTILGQLTLSQERTVLIDPRTTEEKMLNANGGSVRSYKKKLLHFMQVTEAGMASLQPGHALSRDFYIAEAITFAPVWEGHYGIVTSGDRVKRFSTKFLLSTAGNKPREADRLILNTEEHAAITTKEVGRTGMFDLIRERQLENGQLTQALIDAAIAKADNNKPQEAPEQVGETVDEETGEVLESAPIASTGFGGGN